MIDGKQNLLHRCFKLYGGLRPSVEVQFGASKHTMHETTIKITPTRDFLTLHGGEDLGRIRCWAGWGKT